MVPFKNGDNKKEQEIRLFNLQMKYVKKSNIIFWIFFKMSVFTEYFMVESVKQRAPLQIFGFKHLLQCPLNNFT